METTDIYQVDGRQPPVNMVFLEITLDKNWIFLLYKKNRDLRVQGGLS